MSKEVPSDAPHARLCCLKKWSDFNGYGFNLHAEKGKAGQFIGKVDDGSPAEYAGLRKDDRIVEVNGQNIANQNHGQVVELIRRSATGNEVSLLVLDHEADQFYVKRQMVVRGDMTAVVDRIETPVPRPEKRNTEENHTNGEVNVEVTTATVVSATEEKSEDDVEAVDEVIRTETVTVVESAPPLEPEPEPEPQREPTPTPPRTPTPEPEPEFNNVVQETAVTTETVVTTETITSLEINQNEDHKPEPEPVRVPTPEPIQPVHRAPAPQPQQANGTELKLNMSAREYREMLKSNARHSQKSANMGFKNKKDCFERL